VKPTDEPAVFDVEAGLESAAGDFAATVVGDRDHRRPTEVEMIAIPNVGLDDPPPGRARFVLSRERVRGKP
jgi:hypothetical protein